MYAITISLQGAEEHAEVLPGDVETTALLVEDLVSQVLLQLFDEVAIGEVSVRFVPGRSAPPSPPAAGTDTTGPDRGD